MDNPPIHCTGAAAATAACPELATTIVFLHGGVRAIVCPAHLQVVVAEIMEKGHGSCRTEPFEGYPRKDVAHMADSLRGKIAPLGPGPYAHLKKKSQRRG